MDAEDVANMGMREERADIRLGFGSEHVEGVFRGAGSPGYETLGMQ
jgi:hypothetical protein